MSVVGAQSRFLPAGVLFVWLTHREPLSQVEGSDAQAASSGGWPGDHGRHGAAASGGVRWGSARGRMRLLWHARAVDGRDGQEGFGIGSLGAETGGSKRRSLELLSSRCSYELVEKAVLARCPLLAAISAPTALAVEAAREAGLALAVLARDDALLWMAP